MIADSEIAFAAEVDGDSAGMCFCCRTPAQ
jgi:hypothetical protein